MGNDGGSIPKRDDLVKTRRKDEQADKQQQEAARWFFCALSKRALEPPVVSDPLGKLYNKSAAIEYLLNPPSTSSDGTANHSAFGADGDATAAHLSSLKDLVTLTLHPNPAYDPAELDGANSMGSKGRWICPASMKEINGGIGRKDAGRWVYLKGCGCVLTEAGLKQLRAGLTEAEEECLVCGTKFVDGTGRETVTINPGAEEEETMRGALAVKRRVEKEEKERRKKEKKAAKDGKKRKADSSLDPPPLARDSDETPVNGSTKPLKKSKNTTEAVKVRPSAPAPASKLAALIASEAEKKAANQSSAVASIYGPRGPDGKQLLGKQQESWLTRGTWTRYS